MNLLTRRKPQTITANLLKMRHIQPRTEAGGFTLTLHSSLVASSSSYSSSWYSDSTSTYSSWSSYGTEPSDSDSATHPSDGWSTTLQTATHTTTSILSSTKTGAGVKATATTSSSSNSSSLTSAAGSAGRWHLGSLAVPESWCVAGLICASWVVVLIL